MIGSKMKEEQRKIYETYEILWRYHIIWSQSYITALVTGLGNIAYYNDRLFENIDTFEKELLKYHSNDDANTYSLYMENHTLSTIKFAVDALNGSPAIIEEDRMQRDNLVRDWADHLAKMNPYWSSRMWQRLLTEHNRLTEAEIMYGIKYRVPSRELSAATEEQILVVAHYMADGIIQQFNI